MEKNNQTNGLAGSHQWKVKEQVQSYFSGQEINWRFLSPLVPFWEAAMTASLKSIQGASRFAWPGNELCLSPSPTYSPAILFQKKKYSFIYFGFPSLQEFINQAITTKYLKSTPPITTQRYKYAWYLYLNILSWSSLQTTFLSDRTSAKRILSKSDVTKTRQDLYRSCC